MREACCTTSAWRTACFLMAIMTLVCAARGEFEAPVAITGVKVFPGDGPPMEDRVILIEHGRITDVGPGLNVPPHAEVIDASGMVAYPGFICAHGNLGISDEERSEEERVRLEDENPDPAERALVRTRWANRRGIRPQYRAHEHYQPKRKAMDQLRKVGFTTMLVAPPGGLLGGTSALVNLADAPLRRVILATDVAQHASFRADEPGSYPRSLLGTFAQFRQVLLDTGWSIEEQRYYQRHPRKTKRPPVDPALVALQPVLTGQTPVFFLADSQREINRALNLAAEFDLRVIISGAKEAYKVVDRIKTENVPVIVSLDFDEEPDFGKKQKKGGKGKAGKSDKDKIYEPLKLRKERRRLWEEHVDNVITLHQAGVPFCLSTRDFKKPSKLIENLRLVIERGLPVDAALAALTRTPASLLGVSDQVGWIEPGYLANIVVMSGPLEDKESKVRFVLVDGKKIEFDLDEQDKSKKDRGKGKDKDQDQDGQTDNKESEPEGDGPDENAESQEENECPTWRCEIDADRIPKTQTGGNVLIRNATVITVSGPTLQNTSILIDEGKITGIGPNLTAPAGTTVIDATGRWVMPGIVDPHCHIAVSGANEGALSITAEVRVADLVYSDSLALYRALAGGATTALSLHGSANPIGGQNVVIKLKYKRPVSEMIVHDAPRTIKFALGENVTHANSTRSGDRRFPSGRMGVEAVIRDALAGGREYIREWEAYRTEAATGLDVLPPRRDLRLEALADILRGDLWIHAHCYRSDEILRLMKVAEDFGVRIAVLQHVLEGYRIAPEIARHGAGASTFADTWAYKIEAFGAIPHNAALMTERGINTTVNSDSVNRIRRMNIEAAKCIKWGGLSENQAFRLITLNPAIQLGIDHRLGSIEVGKDGDLAIFNGHPLNAYSKNVMTLIDGEVFFQHDRPDPVAPVGPLDWNKQAEMTLPDSPHRLYAIVGGTVHPISAPPIEDGTVVIRNDRIIAVGRDLDIPPGAGIVDAGGLHVYPGLIDGGGSLGLVEIRSVRATRDNSDSATFAPELRAISAVHPHSVHIRVARTGGITSQLVIPSGGNISGQSAVINLDGWTADQMLVQDGVALHMSVPSLPVRLTGDEEEKSKEEKKHKESMRKLEDFVARAKRYAAARQAAEDDPKVAPPIDLRLEAMIPYVRGQKPVIFDASSYKAILDTLDFAEEHGLKPIISGGTEAWKLAEVLKEKDIPVILGTVFSYPWRRFEAWDAIYACASVLDKAGVRWCFESQSAAHAYNLGTGAGLAVAHGLNPDRALYALTLGAAQILGIDDRLGSLEPGKQADVIVTTHPPTQTVARVTHMFIKGRPIELTSIHTENYEKFKNRPRPHLPPKKELLGPPSLTGR